MIGKDTIKDFRKKLDEKFKEVEKSIQKPNILIVGGTGVGKSSIVNMIFGENTVKVGEGKAVTRGINKIDSGNKSVVLYDTEGFEVGNDSEGKFRKEILDKINDWKSKPQANQFHLIWHVIDASTDRVTDYDKSLHKELLDTGVPVALIFSKVDETTPEDLTKMVNVIFPNITWDVTLESKTSPFFTTNIKNVLDEHPSLIINKVIDWSISKLPEVLKIGFISAQVADLKLKRENANSIILQHTSGNTLIGGSPIPFSDAPLLILSQAGMLGRIIHIYDIGEQGSSVKDFMKGQGMQLVVSNLGKSIAGNLLKLIPGVGTVIGGLINATIAGAITYAMGKATSEYFYSLSTKIANGENPTNLISNFDKIFEDLFNQFFKAKKNEGI